MKSIFPLLILLLLSSGAQAEPLSKGESQLARQLFSALGCRACHDFDKSGANLAGSLDRIGLKLNEEKILTRLKQPPAAEQGGNKFMPSYQTTPIEQLKLLSRFLANRK